MAILLSPICQSRPKMGQNSQNRNFECKNDIFWFQWAKYYQKTVMLGLFCSLGVKIAIFGSKTAILGSDTFGFEAVFTFQTPILDQSHSIEVTSFIQLFTEVTNGIKILLLFAYLSIYSYFYDMSLLPNFLFTTDSCIRFWQSLYHKNFVSMAHDKNGQNLFVMQFLCQNFSVCWSLYCQNFHCKNSYLLTRRRYLPEYNMKLLCIFYIPITV